MTARPRRFPDAHGQAALVLVESLIHGLIARSALRVEEAIEIIEVAASIKIDMADEQREPAPLLAESLALLQKMAISLAHDIGR